MVAACISWASRGVDGETTEPLSTGSPEESSRPLGPEATDLPSGCEKRAARPVSAVLVLAGLSRATIPVPYWVVARAIEQDPAQTLVALVELEASGVVVSRCFAGGGALYAMAGESRWRETWSL